MNPAIRRMAVIVFVAFAVIAASLSYTQVIAGPDYRDDPRNARVALGRAGRERGVIITSDGVLVASSEARPFDDRVFQRDYPQGDLYAHVVGASTILFGDSGLEDVRSSALTSGRNSTISGLLTVLTGGDLRARGIRLTIDHTLQNVAREALGDQAGAIVAIDPATGAILAMVSTPSYDPNTLVSESAAAAGDGLDADPSQPLLNRAIAETYAPGSTFKIITTAAALEAGVIGPETRFADPAELELPQSTAVIRNFNREPCRNGESVTLETAFLRSCNTTFGLIGLEIGADLLISQAEAFGFNQEVPFDLNVLTSAIPDAPSFETNQAGLAVTALGERDVRATPLQMALVAAAVPNGGLIMTPYLVEEVFNADGEPTSFTEPTDWRRAVSPATAQLLTGLMERVVTSGTGQRAAVPDVRVAGKTGTAEVEGGPPHAWFIGFAPIDPILGERQIAFAIVVESGGNAGESATGGTLAAPIAARLVEAWLARAT